MKFKQNILTDFVNYKWKIKIKPYMVKIIYYYDDHNGKNDIDLSIKEKYKEKANTTFNGFIFNSCDVIQWLNIRRIRLNKIMDEIR